jgi:hypothetical protein
LTISGVPGRPEEKDKMSVNVQDLLHDVLERFRPLFSPTEAHAHREHIKSHHFAEAEVIWHQCNRRYEEDVATICRMSIAELMAFASVLDEADQARRSEMISATSHRLDTERRSQQMSAPRLQGE